MTDFAKYDGEGRILATGSMPDSMLELQDGNLYIGTVDANSEYIAEGIAVKRPENPATLVGTTLTNLPAPCAIQINDTRYPCTDDTATLHFTQAGTYVITVISFPHLDARFTVTV